MPVSSMEERQRGFKNKGKDMDDGRRRRADVSVKIRKDKKDDQLTKKRQISSDMSLVSPLKENNQQQVATPTIMGMDEIINILLGGGKYTDEVLFNAVQSTRRLLSREKNPPIDKVIKAGEEVFICLFIPVISCQIQNDLTEFCGEEEIKEMPHLERIFVPLHFQGWYQV